MLVFPWFNVKDEKKDMSGLLCVSKNEFSLANHTAFCKAKTQPLPNIMSNSLK